METDNEVSGNGNSYTTEFRQYDPRLGRWKSLDPLMHMFPHMSPYVAFDNNPIYYTDPYGLASEGGPDGGDKRGGPGMQGDGGGGGAFRYNFEDTRQFSEKEFETKLPKSGNNGDMFFIKLKAINNGDRTSVSYIYEENNNKWRKTVYAKGAEKPAVTRVAGAVDDKSTTLAYMEQKGGNSVTMDHGIAVNGFAPSGVSSGGGATPATEVMGAKTTNNSPTPENTHPSDPNNLASVTGAVVTTVELVRNAKSLEQTGALAGTVDKAVKNGGYVMDGKIYKSGYHGNTAKIAKSVKAAKIMTKTIATLGKVLPVVGTIASTAEFLSGEMEAIDQAKYGLDLFMTGLSVGVPGIGTAISTVYFVSRIFW